MRECAINWISGEMTATVTAASSTRLKGKIEKLANEFPDEVKIIIRNGDGSIMAHVPVKWVKVGEPPKRELSEEQKEANAERLRLAREKQKAEKLLAGSMPEE